MFFQHALVPPEVLIETYWNVKVFQCFRFSKLFHVLIETYWNVKSFNDVDIIHLYFVLIETYWNVK